MTKDRIKGMFLGTFIGDALGLPVESWAVDKIREKHGRITDYLEVTDHKYLKDSPKGTYSDDTQLTLAVANGMIDAGGLDMDTQAERHVEAYTKSTKGWGKSTRESVRRLLNGADYNGSAVIGQNMGVGNGVAMKVSPVGAWIANYGPSESIKFLAELTLMTHWTSIAASSALAQAYGIAYCLESRPQNFLKEEFVFRCTMASSWGQHIIPKTITDDDITARFRSLFKRDMEPEEIIEEFGGGTCYCYNSVPFTHAFFLRNPTNIDSLYDIVSAGGDTDSNGSMLGALLGALNGASVFPQHLINGLDQDQLAEVLEVVDRFCEEFEYED